MFGRGGGRATSGPSRMGSILLSTLPELTPDFDQVITRLSIAANVDNPLVGGNSSRFGIFLALPVANTVWILPGPMSAANQGLVLAAGIQQQYFNFRDHGPMVGRDWHCWTAVPGQTILIIETIYRPT